MSTMTLTNIVCPTCGADGYDVDDLEPGDATTILFACDECSEPIEVEVTVDVRRPADVSDAPGLLILPREVQR